MIYGDLIDDLIVLLMFSVPIGGYLLLWCLLLFGKRRG